MIEELILVDARNRAIGRAEKQHVHHVGLRHRAFSIFLVDPRGRLLLQQRSRTKYHSAGLWANSCCGHPRPGERTGQAARRRLHEELGAAASLQYGFRAYYRTALPNGLTENEIVQVYFGLVPPKIAPDPNEVSRLKRMSLVGLRADIARRPQQYAYWIRHYLESHYAAINRGVRATHRIKPAPAGSRSPR